MIALKYTIQIELNSQMEKKMRSTHFYCTFRSFIAWTLLAFASLFVVSSNAFCQEDDLLEYRQSRIASAVEGFMSTHKYKLGIIRVLPVGSLRAGYDTNALYTQEDPITDYYIETMVGASIGMKFGHAAYLRIIEQFTFLYYKELDQRRDIFNTTRAEFVTGTGETLITFRGGYLSNREPLNNEVDIPVDTKSWDLGVLVDHTLTSKLDLVGSFDFNHIRYEPIEGVAPGIPPLSTGTRSYTFGAGVHYWLSDTFKITTDGYAGYAYDVESDFSSTYWSFLGGVRFTKRRWAGHARGGIGQSDTGNGSQSTYLMSGDVTYLIGKRLSVGFGASRNYQLSGFASGAYYIQTQGDFHFSVPVIERVSVSGSYTFGENDYGDVPVNNQIIDSDTYRSARLTANVRVVWRFYVVTGVEYYKRDSNIPGLSKELTNFLLGFGISLF